MPKKRRSEVRERSFRMLLDRLENYSSLSAACRDTAPQLEVGTETLRKWVIQAQADSGAMPGATTEQLAEMAKLERSNAELRETIDILKAAAVFLR